MADLAVNKAPLYLHAERALHVSLKKPALYIRAEKQADRIFPLRRIERIQVSGPVNWSGDALTACAEQGITIQFLDQQGETRGRLVGCGAGRQDLTELIQQMLNWPDWQLRYRQWCHGVENQTRRYAAQRLGFQFSDARQLRTLERWNALDLLEYAAQTDLDRALQWLREELYGQITGQLYQRGLWQHSPLCLTEPVDLARDLTAVLQSIVLVVRDRQIRLQPQQTLTRRNVAHWSLKQRTFIDNQIARLINRLEIWILEGA